MSPTNQTTIILSLLTLLAILILLFLYRRYKQSQKLSKLRRSINKYFSKSEVVFKKASGQIDQTCSDRVKVGQLSTNQAFANIFEETHISQPSTKQCTLDMSVDEDDGREEPDFNKVFEKTQARPKISKLRKRLANKVKVVEEQKKNDQSEFHNLDNNDDDIAIE